MAEPELTPYERIKVQMEYVVPLLRDLQDELGEDAVLRALEARLEKRIAKAEQHARTDVSPERRLAGAEESFVHFGAGDVLEFEVVETAGVDRLGVDVTACGYARLMASMQATDLGHLLICSEDHVLVAAAGTTLERTQTCMQGGSHCDFRFGIAEG